MASYSVPLASYGQGVPGEPEDPIWAAVTSQPREVRALRVTRAPVIDGRLNEEIWKEAADPGPLVQTNPFSRERPTERTEFRLLYDDDYLYVGVWCYDREPDKILAREMERDGDLGNDDSVRIAIDTFHDLRNGYFFRFNPNGARYDALISNNDTGSGSWDGIWAVRTTIDGEGWKAEMAIPFKTVSFDPETTSWGFNIARSIKRKGESVRWSGYNRNTNTYEVAEAGTVYGLQGLKQGIGLDVKPYVLGRYSAERKFSENDDYEFEGGMDLRYRLAPNLTASLSVNTDFAETEVDSRQINLTRFPLFFPEKRDFFLEDAGIFQFGGLSSGDFLPFFSRRIGLDEDGQPVPIIAAAKVTGRVNDYNIGVLDAVVDGPADVGTENALVARVSRNVLEQSQVGVLATYGDPNSNTDNLVGGMDFTFRNRDLFADQLVEFETFVLGSHTEDEDNDTPLAFGAEYSMPNDDYRVRVEMFQIDDDFDAALGFVPRRGIRNYESELSYRPQPPPNDWIRRFFFSYSTEYVTDLDDRLETAEHDFWPLLIFFESQDQLGFKVSHELDAPEEEFEISEGVVIPADEYWWTDFQVTFDTASKRWYELDASYRWGEFYDGHRDRYTVGVDFRLIKWVLLGTSYSLNNVRLPQGDFTTRLASLRVSKNFTPDLSWTNLLQFDSVSDTIGLNSRIRWEFQPGNQLFIVLNQNLDREDSRLEALETELTVKLGMTIRF